MLDGEPVASMPQSREPNQLALVVVVVWRVTTKEKRNEPSNTEAHCHDVIQVTHHGEEALTQVSRGTPMQDMVSELVELQQQQDQFK
jgi:hypothetical protein